jgi:DNA-binding CsgD family transcriptional regulator
MGVEEATFVGRSEELHQLADLLADAQDGQSRVVVLRGEAGVGKTKLIEALVAGSSGCRVVRSIGVESEAEFAFAGLHQLCVPLIDGLNELPMPQQDALNGAFGFGATTRPERFLIGLATLSLLSASAEEQPLLCVVDDAQWLDRESLQTLGFVARRLLTERILMVFAARDHRDEFAGLPEQVVDGLGEEDASVLLSSVVHEPLTPALRERIVAETRGNPLALLELPRGLSAAELAVGFGVSAPGPLAQRIEDTFGRRIKGLPAASQRLLLVAAADQFGQPDNIWRAAESLGIGPEAAEPAAVADLLDIDSRHVQFRHPLVRSATYQGATYNERRLVHQALADATNPRVDPDVRAWHLAEATASPNEEVANELEQSAGRAHERGGSVAAATFFERSAALTPAPEQRALRRLLAAGAYLEAGMIDRARELLEQSAELDDPAARANALRLEGAIRFADGRGRDTPTLLFRAATGFRDLDPRMANETMMEALEAAMWAGHLTTGTTTFDVAEETRSWFEPDDEETTASSLLQGYVRRLTTGYPGPVAHWRRALQAGADDVGGSTRLQLLGMLWNASGDMLDFENHRAVARERVRQAREDGALATLPVALSCLAWSELLAGNFDTADAFDTEGSEIASATGTPEFPGAHGIIRAGILAWRGDESGLDQLAADVRSEAVERGQGMTIKIMDMVVATLELGYERYDDARQHTSAVFDADPLYVCSMTLADLIEAASRCDDRDTAHAALARLADRAEASRIPWALGLWNRGRALLAPTDEVERLYREALEQLARSGVMTALARTQLLYGEWLLGAAREADAQKELRAAYERFAEMGAEAFRARTQRQLGAGFPVRQAPAVTARDELTGRELQIARLAADGATNSEIAAQVFLSDSTVDYHLRKVFKKLSVTSRRQLAPKLASSL